MPTATAEELLTSPGVAMWTVAYMSPEQARGEQLDARTDLFSFGVVLYEMATGQQAFAGSTSAVIFDAILNRTPKPLLQLIPALNVELERIVGKALEKDRDLRYQSAAELRSDLKRLKRDTDSGRVARGAATRASEAAPAVSREAQRIQKPLVVVAAAAAIFLLLGALLVYRSKKAPPPCSSSWEPLTDFADSATSPALSPDGRMLAFIRGPDTFVSSGQIYVKLLPGGDPVRLTHDNLPKMSPIFTPDGSRIAYTVPWDTWVVPVLGGEPQRMLPNASGLTWTDEHHLLFSEIKTGVHMAIATAAENRTESRDLYVPPHERGMAHRSYRSPDGKWVLLVEMENGGWLPCRLVPFDGSSPGKQVGPPDAACTYAGWSPDGNWMYLNTNAGGGYHIWRQAFPDGKPEQITSGPTQEEGISLGPDGHFLVTSVGSAQSTVWVHDPKGDRQIYSEGFALLPEFGSVFSPDGRKLYYTVARGRVRAFWAGELWMADLDSGRTERLLPDVLITDYDISSDGKQVVYATADSQGQSRIWITPLDRRTPPRELSKSPGEDVPIFDRNGNIFFRVSDGKQNYIYHMKEDGSQRTKAVTDPIIFFESVSPNGQWVLAQIATPSGESSGRTVAFPTTGGSPLAVCDDCSLKWTHDGQYLYLGFPSWGALEPYEEKRQGRSGKAYIIPLKSGRRFESLAAHGLPSQAKLAALPGVRLIENVEVSPYLQIYPGPNPSIYAYLRTSVHRNIYRIPVP
jgi:Tol biopolymer transport system component